jgi:uncharacterized protein (TIGR00661 family)
MRIAYGVMGYGRGHSIRARAVLPALMREHEVTVFAGGDAYAMLAADFPTMRIPTLGYVYGRSGHASFPATISANAGQTTQLLLGGPSLRAVMGEFQRLGIELAISDSEAWTHQAARRLGIPRIGFDHVGVIAFCKPHYPAELAWRGRRDAWGYRRLMGRPDRVIVSSFYPVQPLAAGTQVVGPILRPEVRAASARPGDYLLCYFNKGHLQYTPRLERELQELDLPVVIYGTPEQGTRGNLTFRPIDPLRFVHDFAGCRAVIATAGNQLIGEALHFRKPVLALPERVFEQELNAWIVERLGIGRSSRFATVTADEIELFLAEVPACTARMEGYGGDGTAEAIAGLRRCIGELGAERRRDLVGSEPTA